MQIRVVALVAGLAFASCCATIAAPSAPTTFPAGRMRVDRNILRDARNRPIPLFGANADAFSLNVSDLEAQSAFFHMRSWNMNAAWISSSITDWQKDPARHLAHLESLAQVAGIQQIILIITLANDAPQRHKLPIPAAVEYWKSVSTKLKDAPGVIFDLLDDPRLDDTAGNFAGGGLGVLAERRYT
jgi:hypothetical protein